RILRAKLPRRLVISPPEKQRLLKFGRPLGKALGQLLSIVSLRTFRRWLSGEDRPRPAAATGRPRTPEDLRALVLRLARANTWGYTRILGELKKLGLAQVSRSTVVNTLREAGLEPAPRRGEGTWHDFVRRHSATLWACDFFSKRVWTPRGLVECFVLFFLHV